MARSDAVAHLRLTLVTFAVSVLGIRIYLAATGYPQIGGQTLHIAHALWGGLLLFVASLLPLLIADRRVLTTVALLSGVGAGLFVDEVGKFITADNDYFFPAAAPIAYAVFLLTVLVGLRFVGRSRECSPRADLRAALDLIAAALDSDLTPVQRAELDRRLRAAATPGADPSDAPSEEELRHLAAGLLEVVPSSGLQLAPVRPGRLRRLVSRLDRWVDRRLTERLLRTGLLVGLTVLGLVAVSDLAVITAIAVDLSDGSTSELTDVANGFARIEIEDARGVGFLFARAVLDVLAGSMLVVAAVLLVRGRRRSAMELARHGLLLFLTVVNLLLFYLEQFAAAAAALVQLALLYGVRRYQDHFVERS
ncbi:hypothetical protein DQ238_13110 [Geodermatophilus sp. TF02-6]|nr:hypothetical protein DQ238_13110 [Geodermatophilus sp. TF02-6]